MSKGGLLVSTPAGLSYIASPLSVLSTVIGQAYQRGEDIEDGGRYIYVFDLKGNPVRKYVLDHAIYGIDVDEDTGTILATDVNSNDPILSFKI